MAALSSFCAGEYLIVQYKSTGRNTPYYCGFYSLKEVQSVKHENCVPEECLAIRHVNLVGQLLARH